MQVWRVRNKMYYYYYVNHNVNNVHYLTMNIVRHYKLGFLKCLKPKIVNHLILGWQLGLALKLRFEPDT